MIRAAMAWLITSTVIRSKMVAWLTFISFMVLDRFEAGLFSSIMTLLGKLSIDGALEDARLK